MLGFISALPGAVSQGLIWGIMAIGVFITYKILDIADLTVDGSFCTGGAVFVMLFTTGANIWLALLAAVAVGMLAGLVTGLLHTLCGIPAILAGILTQLGLWSVNMAIMGMKASVAVNVTNPDTLNSLLVSLRFVQDVAKGTRPFYRHPIFVGHRLQRQHGTGPGHQYRLYQGAGPGDLQRPGGSVRRPAGPV